MTTHEVTIQGPELYPKQYWAFFREETFGYVEGSTKSGKTVAAITWMAKQAMEAPTNREFLWIGPFSHQAEMAFDKFKELVPEELWSSNQKKMFIDFHDGGKIWFKSGEKPDTIYGYEFWAVVVDEASRVREESWKAARSTREATEGPVRAIGNVTDRNNWHWQNCRMAEAGELNDAYYIRLTCEDSVRAGIISAESIKNTRAEYKRRGKLEEFLALYFCIAPQEGGNPFGIRSIERCTIDPEEWDRPPEGFTKDGFSLKPPVCWGWDLARSTNYTVGVPLDENGYVTDKYTRFQRSWPETKREIVRRSGRAPILVDSTGVGDPIVGFLQETSVNLTPFSFQTLTKQHLMERLRVGIQEERTHFPAGTQIESELKAFESKQKGNTTKYCAPQGRHDDCVDALALAWFLYEKQMQLKKIQEQSGSLSTGTNLSNPFKG